MRKRSAVVTSVVLAGVLAGASGSAQAAPDAPSLGARPVFLVGSAAAVDASTAAPVAARAGGSLLFADPHGLPAATKAFLDASSPTSVVIVGGERSIGADVQAALAASHPVHRYGGANRQETAAQLAGLAASLPAVKGEKGDKGDTGGGSTGATGPQGAQGIQGLTGPGVPSGGSADQVLKWTGSGPTNTAWSAVPSTALSMAVFENTSAQTFGDLPSLQQISFPSPQQSSGPSLYTLSAQDTATVTQAGYYQVGASIRLEKVTGAANTGERYLAVQVGTTANGSTTWKAVSEATSSFDGVVVLNASATVYLAPTQQVRVMLLNKNGSSLSVRTVGDTYARMSVVQLPTTMPS